MALTTIAELEKRLGEEVGSLTGEELARAEEAIEDASVIVQSFGRRSWTDSEGDNPAPPIAVVITLRLAKRIYLNPDENRWEQLGDLTQGKADPTNLLTDDEKTLIQEAAGIARGVYSVRTPSGYVAEG